MSGATGPEWDDEPSAEPSVPGPEKLPDQPAAPGPEKLLNQPAAPGPEKLLNQPAAPGPEKLPDAMYPLNSSESDFFGLAIRRRARVAQNIAMDGALILVFAAISFLVNWGLSRIQLEGVAATTRDVISAVFAISTVGCCVLLMIADLYELAKELFRR